MNELCVESNKSSCPRCSVRFPRGSAPEPTLPNQRARHGKGQRFALGEYLPGALFGRAQVGPEEVTNQLAVGPKQCE